ncbi:hypothetical protein CAEBREN_08446 [Caenorhabditis brenneri]|uniref:Protein kinase domain-containing protein n=1 Tax=Caenorhabditis brenneri TaxID=135651 RepID=G0MQY2_CAEBE|nr:hypothetical protein CAEBREN_08446 [Caenorhabditis brenneri]
MSENKSHDNIENMMNNLHCGRNPQNRPPPPLSMKDFLMKQALGKGAYGNVYRVQNIRDGKDYALKQISIHAGQNGVPQSVLREISTMKQLSRKGHPNILNLHSVFHQTSQGILTVNMILERCDWDLHTFLKGIPSGLPDKQCRHLTIQIVRALDFLHSHGIIHRDLKPQNILVNRDQTVKLADFGLSKEYSNTTAFTTLVVTLWYRSPEVILQSFYNSAIDMWALGCIVSEIYNRDPLFPGQDEAQQLTCILRKLGLPSIKDWPRESVIVRSSFPEFTPQSLQTRCLAGDALNFVEQCLRFDPKRRISARVALTHPYLKPLGVMQPVNG